MRVLQVAAGLVLAVVISACGGGGGGGATSGSVSGNIIIGGPINGAVELLVGLFDTDSSTISESATAGHVTSAATGSLSGRTLSFDFSAVAFGNYRVVVYSQSGAVPTYWYQSDPFTLSANTPNIDNFSGQMSFSGPGPWGTISGVVLLEGNTTWPPANLLVFVGFNPVAEPTNILQWLVSEDDVNSGRIVYNVDHLVYGSYNVGLYGYDPVTHQVFVYGAFDSAVALSAGDVNATNVNFPADFDGDPGTDPQLGSISGTINFNGQLPEGLFISVGANTLPPQAGAPIASFDVTPEAVGIDFAVDYTLAGLPNDEYSVAIFSYDFATHQATYFGTFSGTVTVDDANLNHSGIDFDADVTLIGGTQTN